uniref:Uncharacterized protein n=1 Tax=Peronospora matthiolae TaxID=2874970 RepID=A0AAV1TUE1_9STRA
MTRRCVHVELSSAKSLGFWCEGAWQCRISKHVLLYATVEHICKAEDITVNGLHGKHLFVYGGANLELMQTRGWVYGTDSMFVLLKHRVEPEVKASVQKELFHVRVVYFDRITLPALFVFPFSQFWCIGWQGGVGCYPRLASLPL